jgi:hypothetical protein
MPCAGSSFVESWKKCYQIRSGNSENATRAPVPDALAHDFRDGHERRAATVLSFFETVGGPVYAAATLVFRIEEAMAVFDCKSARPERQDQSMRWRVGLDLRPCRAARVVTALGGREGREVPVVSAGPFALIRR